MVRLKAVVPVCAMPPEMFQFHSGSIKSEATRFERFAVSTFQFHSGSIKSDIGNIALHHSLMFQFHSGSIKSYALYAMPVSPSNVSIP